MPHRYAYVPQVDMRDCGVAALATVAKHYGSEYSLAHLRELAKTDRNGTTALGIVEAAKRIGFETKAIRADMTLFDMDDIPYPFIAHILKDGKLLHYVVVYNATDSHLVVADPDPQTGIHKVDKRDFKREWSGVALFIAPTPRYRPKKDRKAGLWSFTPLLVKNRQIIANIVIAALLVTIITLAGSYYLQSLIDTYIPSGMSSTLGVVSLGLVIAYILQQVLSYARQYLLTILGQRLTIDVVLSYIRHVFELPMSFFSTRRTGEIISRFTDANSIIDALASTVISMFLDIGTVIIIGVALGMQNTSLFLMTLTALPIYAIIILVFVKPFERMNNDMMQANAIVSSSIIEDINGIETIKALTSEQERYERIDREFIAYLNKSFDYDKLENLQEALKTGARLLLNIAVLWMGSRLVMDNTISVGQLVTYNTLLGCFTDPMLNIINLQTKLQSARVANNRLNEVFRVESERRINQVITDPRQLDGPIRFDHVSYRFGYGRDTLSDINLTVETGEKLAVVGTSGSGKTTLAKLLVGFYDATDGEVRIGNAGVEQVNRSTLRRYVNYLPQEPYIFSGTVMDNLTLGARPDITQDDIMRAVESAEIRHDIEHMPMGYATELSSEASPISGGQKQRIALARALLTDAQVLILDEATSALDMATEKRIINNLLKLDKTIIFIAHRLNVAKRCESILVMEDGHIIEHGTHDELMAAHERYYHLFQD